MRAKIVALSGQQMKVEARLAVCDKCGKPVPIKNDAVFLQMRVTNDLSLITAQPRHLLPTEDCEGSPSRAQYLEGQPSDSQYAYHPELEAPMREAYRKMQEEEL